MGMRVARELPDRGEIRGEVGRAVGEGDALQHAGPGVELAVGDLLGVGEEAGLEGLDRLVNLARRDVDLRRSTPDRDRAIHARLFLEGPDVLAELLDQLGLVGGRLDVRAVEALHVLGVERALHRADLRELLADRVDVLLLEHLGVVGHRRCVVGEDVPGAEGDVVELRQRDELTDRGAAVVGPLAEPDGAHLGERAHGSPQAATREQDSRDGG